VTGSVRVRVKICGLTRPADVTAACAAGVDAIGLNRIRGPRLVDRAAAAVLARIAPPPVSVVLLVADRDEATILDELAAIRATAVQLHGDEPPELADRLRRRLPVIKAFAAGTSPEVVRAYPCDAALVDAPRSPAGFGGTGQVWDYAALAGQDLGHPVLLAGGLTPANVAGAIRAVRPWAVDTASGVESAPGIKDAAALAAFCAAAHGAV
jgi:phosphoribosylanthranilate isomerase